LSISGEASQYLKIPLILVNDWLTQFDPLTVLEVAELFGNFEEVEECAIRAVMQQSQEQKSKSKCFHFC
jgi:hypothetical protein